jgi:hypothetical protein
VKTGWQGEATDSFCEWFIRRKLQHCEEWFIRRKLHREESFREATESFFTIQLAMKHGLPLETLTLRNALL